MRDKVLIFFGTLVVAALAIFVPFYVYLYNYKIDEQGNSEPERKLMNILRGEGSAKFFSLLAMNSRVYKDFLLDEAQKNTDKRPANSWRGEALAVVGVGNATTNNIYQGVNEKTAIFSGAVPKSWDKSRRVITVSIDGRDWEFKLDGSTLVYRLTFSEPKKLVARGSMGGEEMMKGNTLSLFVIDDGEYPVVLDALVLVL